MVLRFKLSDVDAVPDFKADGPLIRLLLSLVTREAASLHVRKNCSSIPAQGSILDESCCWDLQLLMLEVLEQLPLRLLLALGQGVSKVMAISSSSNPSSFSFNPIMDEDVPLVDCCRPIKSE
jgi:hypothetical protein